MQSTAASGGGDSGITSPLLQGSGQDEQQQQHSGDWDSRQCDESLSGSWEGESRQAGNWNWHTTAAEAKTQLGMAAPMIGVNIFQSTLTIVSVMFVGHLGELSLASSSIATSFATVTGYSVMVTTAIFFHQLLASKSSIKPTVPESSLDRSETL